MWHYQIVEKDHNRELVDFNLTQSTVFEIFVPVKIIVCVK